MRLDINWLDELDEDEPEAVRLDEDVLTAEAELLDPSEIIDDELDAFDAEFEPEEILAEDANTQVAIHEGGRLTEAVRRKPYSVILLDETGRELYFPYVSPENSVVGSLQSNPPAASRAAGTAPPSRSSRSSICFVMVRAFCLSSGLKARLTNSWPRASPRSRST